MKVGNKSIGFKAKMLLFEDFDLGRLLWHQICTFNAPRFGERSLHKEQICSALRFIKPLKVFPKSVCNPSSAAEIWNPTNISPGVAVTLPHLRWADLSHVDRLGHICQGGHAGGGDVEHGGDIGRPGAGVQLKEPGDVPAGRQDDYRQDVAHPWQRGEPGGHELISDE